MAITQWTSENEEEAQQPASMTRRERLHKDSRTASPAGEPRPEQSVASLLLPPVGAASPQSWGRPAPRLISVPSEPVREPEPEPVRQPEPEPAARPALEAVARPALAPVDTPAAVARPAGEPAVVVSLPEPPAAVILDELPEEVAERILAPEPPAALVQALERVIAPVQTVEPVAEPTAATEPTPVGEPAASSEPTPVGEPPGWLDPARERPAKRVPVKEPRAEREALAPVTRLARRFFASPEEIPAPPAEERAGETPRDLQLRIYMRAILEPWWTGGMSSSDALAQLTALGQKHL